MTKHHPCTRCLVCGDDIPPWRISEDPPEFFCSDQHEARFRVLSGIGSTFDLAWPDSGNPYNPALAIIRSGRGKDGIRPSERVLRRVKLVPHDDGLVISGLIDIDHLIDEHVGGKLCPGCKKVWRVQMLDSCPDCEGRLEYSGFKFCPECGENLVDTPIPDWLKKKGFWSMGVQVSDRID